MAVGIIMFVCCVCARVIFVPQASHHVYLTRDGRMSIAGLKPADIKYTAEAIKQAIATVG
jgi:aspartate/tyrosine/aromatic aminotransferase